ncbi:MAG: hypothetical protein HY255_08000 [Betaproteobacteria bacterium]|nr:hypothetical protein [Betaproteobacteria bacterium]
MPFSWKALLIAPLPVPLACVTLFFALSQPARVPQSIGDHLIFYVLFLLAGCIVSYGAVIFLLLPGLLVASRFVALKAWLTALVGLCAGLVVFLAYLWVSYTSSGPDSGPPVGTFADYLFSHGLDWDSLFFLVPALVTTMLYWVLARPRQDSTSWLTENGQD